jgi:hypothetical protein
MGTEFALMEELTDGELMLIAPTLPLSNQSKVESVKAFVCALEAALSVANRRQSKFTNDLFV